ncbi:MAG: DUF6879 family protein [Pseudonocardiaceae bacterium]
MRITRTLRDTCGASETCDKILDTDDPIDLLVQGRHVDPALLTKYGIPQQEGLLAVKRTVLPAVDAPLLDADQFGALLGRLFTRTLFRVETRGYYADDEPEFAKWRRGESGPDLAWKAGWLDKLRRDRDAGRQRRVLHVIDGLTDYLRYETAWCYRPNQDAGQDIRILDLAATHLPPSLVRAGDFLVVDDDTVVRMHYSGEGAFEGASVVNRDPAVFVALRDLMWAAAEPFPSWWARHAELHTGQAA